MQEQKSSFPFSMVERMMPWYPGIAVMGWDIILAAFLFSAITVALTVIIGTLQMQTKMLTGLVQKAG
jgi:hypothetical protein